MNNIMIENVFKKHLASVATNFCLTDRQAYEFAKAETKKELGLKKVSIARNDAMRTRFAEKKEQRKEQKTVERRPASNEERLHHAIASKGQQILSQCDYRRATSSWAGGNTIFRVLIGEQIGAGGGGDKVWSSNGKWSGLDAYYTARVERTWLRKVYAENLGNVDGLFTLAAEKEAETSQYVAYRASWMKQSRGFSVTVEDGYIVRLANGETAHGNSIKSALNTLVVRENFDKTKIMKQTIIPELYPEVYVTMRDSLDSGNCRPGTENWVNAHFPGQRKAKVKDLLLADGRNPLVRRACEMSIRKYLIREKLKSLRKEAI